jgi:hypothetical protein
MPPSRRSTRGGSGGGPGTTANAAVANAAVANAPVSANATSEKKDEVVRVVHGMKFTSEDAAELHGLLASAGKGATGGTKSKLGLVRIRIFRGRA